ncbi:hypothetical protein RND81_07G182800 [Saponaria officinalis]|uniref:Fatty acid desaturase domain-containing protein n=1 Tax=Saponaria officinalis TaxID=3572 RepID=A0AAW1JTI7_SAPOF
MDKNASKIISQNTTTHYYEKPPFTINQIRKAIPPRCFHRSLLRSFSYLLHDLTISFILYYITHNYFHLLPKPLSYIAWPIYWFAQGSIMFGLWVLGHESAHNAFSDYKWLDDIVGLVIYSSLLVPYYSFKMSHKRHHANTGSLENEEVYVPRKRENIQWYFSKYFNNPPGRVLTLFITLTLGWPLYLLFNVSGKKYERFASHYDPYGPIHGKSVQVLISDIGVFVTLYGVYRFAIAHGFVHMICMYGIPLVVVNMFVVLVTYLHHTHPSVPYYDSSEWNWLRGALSTIDRDYGTIMNKIFHHCTDAHVIHHLFASMPHYNAREATEAIKPILGAYYQSDNTPFHKALWREAKECLYVVADKREHHKGVWWYSNKL